MLKHRLPLKFVEYNAFRDFVDYCKPLVKSMSKKILKNEILKPYNVENVKVMNLLEINDSKVAITTNIWTTTNKKKCCMVVTGHLLEINNSMVAITIVN